MKYEGKAMTVGARDEGVHSVDASLTHLPQHICL